MQFSDEIQAEEERAGRYLCQQLRFAFPVSPGLPKAWRRRFRVKVTSKLGVHRLR